MHLSDIDYRRAIALPFGLTAHFSFVGGHFECAWAPDHPARLIRKPKAKRRFIAAYTEARNDFIRDLATLLGGKVGVIDTDDWGLTTIEPGTRQ